MEETKTVKQIAVENGFSVTILRRFANLYLDSTGSPGKQSGKTRQLDFVERNMLVQLYILNQELGISHKGLKKLSKLRIRARYDIIARIKDSKYLAP